MRLEGQFYGAFQSKLDFRQGSDLEIIAYSAERLRAWLEAHPTRTVHLAFPGIGLGGLEPKALQGRKRTLEGLGERVRLYTL